MKNKIMLRIKELEGNCAFFFEEHQKEELAQQKQMKDELLFLRSLLECDCLPVPSVN